MLDLILLIIEERTVYVEQLLWLLPLGFLVGAFGTMIGAGGGFILVPILLLIYPEKSPSTITSISLAIVFFNALSGSFAYAKMKRIDYKSGLIFAMATIPGSILGALTTAYIPRHLFNGIFGLILVCLSLFLMLHPTNIKNLEKNIPLNHIVRTVTDAEGETYTFSYNPVIGVVLSIIVGYVSSLLGIGGGIIHVPALVHLLNYPVHIATATSHFILAVMSFTSTVVHVSTGALSNSLIQTIGLSIGALFGAQLGAKISNRFNGVWVIRSLAVALGIVGIRILMMSF